MMGDTKELAVPDRILDRVAKVIVKVVAKGLEIGKWGATGRTGNMLSAFTPGSIEHAPHGLGRNREAILQMIFISDVKSDMSW
jgi:hypothetical protein